MHRPQGLVARGPRGWPVGGFSVVSDGRCATCRRIAQLRRSDVTPEDDALVVRVGEDWLRIPASDVNPVDVYSNWLEVLGFLDRYPSTRLLAGRFDGDADLTAFADSALLRCSAAVDADRPVGPHPLHPNPVDRPIRRRPGPRPPDRAGPGASATNGPTAYTVTAGDRGDPWPRRYRAGPGLLRPRHRRPPRRPCPLKGNTVQLVMVAIR